MTRPWRGFRCPKRRYSNGPTTTGIGISQITSNQRILPVRECSSSKSIYVTIKWPTIGNRIITRNKSEFTAQPLFPDTFSSPHSDVFHLTIPDQIPSTQLLLSYDPTIFYRTLHYLRLSELIGFGKQAQEWCYIFGDLLLRYDSNQTRGAWSFESVSLSAWKKRM